MRVLRLVAVASIAMSPLPALAADITIEMLSKDPTTNLRNVFAPALAQIEPGDTVTWAATGRGHNVEFIKGAFPEGVEAFRSKLGKNVSYVFTEPGIYAYKCTPHYGLGMVGIVVVGDKTEQAAKIAGKQYPGKASKRIKKFLAPLT